MPWFFVEECFPVKAMAASSRQEEDEFQEVLAAKLQSEVWKREVKLEYQKTSNSFTLENESGT